MIEFTKAFKASNGCVYPSLMEAQKAEIRGMLEAARSDLKMHDDANWSDDDVASFIAISGPKIVDILTTTESSRPKARKANGGTKKRKPATFQTSETSPA